MNGSLSPREPGDQVSIEIPATLRHLNILGACLLAWSERMTPSLAPEVVQSMELAIQEAATNIVTHGYEQAPPGRIEMTLAAYPDEIVVELADTGIEFDPATAPKPNLDVPTVHGYGVYLLHQLMNHVEFQREGERNRLRLHKRRIA
jgi:anti-sigma regulatory factor (Ser/Thr protein kinase)